jgi:CMP-N-acetylneuraminic acid synthetase
MSEKYWLNIDSERDLIIAESLILKWKKEILK